MELWIRPRWLRRRSVVALAVLVVGAALAALGFIAPDLLSMGDARIYSAAELIAYKERFQRCASGGDASTLGLCACDEPAFVSHSAQSADYLARLKALREARDESGRRAAEARVAEACRAAAARLVAEIEDELGPGYDARVWMLSNALYGLKGLQVVARFLSPVLLVYGLLSLYWASRRFRLRLTDARLSITPPLGSGGHDLGQLRRVWLDGARVVVVDRSGRSHRSPPLRVGRELRAFVAEADARVQRAAESFGPAVVRRISADSVRLNHLAPVGLVSVAVLAMLVGAAGLLMTGTMGLHGYVTSVVRARGSVGLSSSSAAETCAGARLRWPCTEIEPPTLVTLPSPDQVERWRLDDLSVAWFDGQGIPEPTAVGDELTWLDRLREDGRMGLPYTTSEPNLGSLPQGARVEIERMAATEAERLRDVYRRAWSTPATQLRWESVLRRQEQLRTGFPWLWLRRWSLPYATFFLVFSSMVFIPPLLLRRSRHILLVSPVGLKVRKTLVRFAEIESIEIVRGRVVVRTRDGRTLRSGPLRDKDAARPLVEAVRQRMLDGREAGEERAAEREVRAWRRGRERSLE